MQEASFNGLVKTIFWTFVIIYALKFLARLFIPIVAKKVVEKATEQFQQQAQQNNKNQYNNTSTNKSDKPRETKKVGEYIDYEEID